jgi:hypothetical protein
MAGSVASQEQDVGLTDPRHVQGIARATERGLDFERLTLLRFFQVIDAASADDGQHANVIPLFEVIPQASALARCPRAEDQA